MKMMNLLANCLELLINLLPVISNKLELISRPFFLNISKSGDFGTWRKEFIQPLGEIFFCINIIVLNVSKL